MHESCVRVSACILTLGHILHKHHVVPMLSTAYRNWRKRPFQQPFCPETRPLAIAREHILMLRDRADLETDIGIPVLCISIGVIRSCD